MGTLIVQLLDNEVDSIYEESVLRDAAKGRRNVRVKLDKFKDYR